MRRRRLLADLGAGLAAGLAGCTVTGGPGSGTGNVGMSTNAFRPPDIEVGVGETLVWDNTSDRPHTVTAYGNSIPEDADYFASGGFDSEKAARDSWPDRGNIQPGESYRHTFEVAGEYPYFCIPHERAGMVGKVVVR